MKGKPKKLFTVILKVRQIVKAYSFIRKKFKRIRKNQKQLIYMSSQLGTVQTVAFFGQVANFANVVGTALEDKKISLSEGVQIAFELVPFANSLTNIKTTFAELKDLHSDEVNSIVGIFSQRFDIKNDRAEKFVELCINAILSNLALFNEGKAMLSK
jgi:hypothetical protein